MIKVLPLILILGFLLNPITTVDGYASVDPNDQIPMDHITLNSEGIVKGPFFPADTSGLPPAPSIEQLALNQVEGEFDIPIEHPGTLPVPKFGSTETNPEPLDQVVQTQIKTGSMPSTMSNWEGMSIANTSAGVLPPDTDGQVGPNHYVQVVNHGTTGAWVRVWNKTGTQLYNFGMNALWPSGDPCHDDVLGDPVVLYDQQYDRWLLTQFTFPSTPPYYECIAVSKGPNPTNIPADWYPYSFPVHGIKFPDYPKFGVWPDGYYMMAHQFTSIFQGTGVWVFDRENMLSGLPTTFQYIDLFVVNPFYGGMLPSNWMGSTPPPAGAPNYFIEVEQDWSGSDDVLIIFEAQANWPSGFTFSVADQLVVDSFTWPVCTATRGRCIHQPNSGPQLEAISDRLMMHAWYRNFGAYEVIVANHTVNVGENRAGIRWYEIRKNSGSSNWYIYQQGTYAPNTDHRWMGSIAMDQVGNIALGYSVSSESVFPSIRYTGRLSTDPIGSMPQGEGTIINGSGVQQHTAARWGDYSAMSVDPNDDCTFWYTQEYIQTIGSVPWQTRVASFKFPNCTASPEGIISGTVTDASSGNPFHGASIVVISESTSTEFNTVTAADGTYSILLTVDTYSVSASTFGYFLQTSTGLAVTNGGTIIQDFALNPALLVTLSGIVKDAATDWPLYAKVEITNEPATPVWTDPVTGYYEFQIPDGNSYDLRANAFVPGYLTEEDTVTVSSNTTKNIGLETNLITCEAPGYLVSPCTPQSGGLVVGNVYDANTSDPLNNAQVSNEDGYTTTTKNTPQDVDVNDGFYTIFSPAGEKEFSSTKSGGFGIDDQITEVLSGNTVGQDFYLPAGMLSTLPEYLELAIVNELTTTVSIDLENTGGLPAQYSLLELSSGFTPLGPYQNPQHIVKRHKQGYVTTEGLDLPDPPAADPFAAGDVINSWDPSFPGPWGIALDSKDDSVWVSSPHADWSGDDQIYEFDTSGNPTGMFYTHNLPHSAGPADLAFNWTTGNMWVMNVNTGVSNCIYEINPSTGYTGNSICPGGGTGFSISQRGLAYDPTTDTYYAGGWNDLSIHHFTADGTILSSVDVGFAIAGLAYNPETSHLFAMINADPNPVYVLDIADNYNLIGQFNVSQDFAAYSGAGLEIDCDGNLWAVDQQIDRVHQFESGESAGDMCVFDVPWLSENPESGTVQAQDSNQVDITFRADVPEVDLFGDYYARLKVKHDTPYGPLYIPVTMTVIAPTYGVMIEPDSAESGYPGTTVTYTLQVMNTGNTSDAFDLLISGNNWNTTGPVTIDTLASGEEREIEINVDIPIIASIGEEDTAKITILSKSDQAKMGVSVLNTSAKGYKNIFPLVYK